MTYGMSPLRRALYFILPLVFGLILTGIVVIDAANTPRPGTATMEIELPEGYDWILFDVDEVAAGPAIVGTKITVEAGRKILSGEVPEETSQLLFNLGENAEVSAVQITWPNGRVQEYGSIPTNARYEISYPATATQAFEQWLEMNGPLYKLGVYVVLGLLLILLAIRIVVWAQRGTDSHGEPFMR